MALTLRIEYSDGTTTDLPADTLSVTRALDEQDRAEMQVPRDDWTSAEPSTPRTAKCYALVNGTREFGGRLDDVKTDGGTATVRLNSPEIDAAEAEPTPANLTYENVTDDAVVTDQVQAVPTLSAGTITQQASGLSYSVSHGSRSKVLYDLRKATGSEFRYNGDWTVDYVDRLGSDKSASVTLGPAAGNIGDDFSKQQDIRENVTHVQALGAQSGPAQITATGVAPSYSAGRKIWRRYENKEAVEQSRLQSIADELVAEYDGEPRALTVECTVYPNQIGADLALGDTVDVDYPAEDIQRSLRITQIMFEWTRRGFLALLTLSNRALTGEDRETKARDDLQRFNRGYQGFVDRNQTTSGWNPAGDGTPQTLEIPTWPDDIVSEERVELTVQGRAWRAPLDITDHDHSVSVTHPKHDHSVSVTHPEHDHSVSTTTADNSDLTSTAGSDALGVAFTLSEGESTEIGNFSPDEHTSRVLVFANINITDVSGGDTDSSNLFVELKNATTGAEYPTKNASFYTFGVESTELGQYSFYTEDPTDCLGETLHLNISNDAGFGQNLPDVSGVVDVYFMAIGRHAHGVADTSTAALGTTETNTSSTELGETETSTTDAKTPGRARVIDTFGGSQYYPTDVEIKVNGSVVATITGDSTTDWQETIDLSGELGPGSNTITAEPTGERGEVNLILSSELFRRGKTN